MEKEIREIRGWPGVVEDSGGKWYPASERVPPKNTTLTVHPPHSS
jgi:hypothetical protein